jgi:hypothetical protein
MATPVTIRTAWRLAVVALVAGFPTLIAGAVWSTALAYVGVVLLLAGLGLLFLAGVAADHYDRERFSSRR